MDFANYWFSGFGGEGPGPGPDAGDPIGQSLRFRGAQNLKRNNVATPADTNVWTYSVWLKRGKLGARQDLFDASNDDSADLIEIYFGGGDEFNVSKTGSGGAASDARFRDPSAWYGVVIQNDGTDLIAFINGDEIWRWASSGGASGINQGGNEQCIGSENFTNGDFLFTTGYMAAVYFIDGQALEPTAFGRENDNGVWVPRDVDFTPATMRLSDFLTAEGGFVADSGGNAGSANYAFNGNLEQRATTVQGDSVVTFAPEPAIDFTDGVEVMVRSNSIASLNGAASVNTNAGESQVWTELATGAGSITTITAQARNGSATAVYGFRINPGTATEQILLNPYIWSADLTCPSGFDANGPGFAFNGSDTNQASALLGGAANPLTFAPRTDVNYNQLEVHCTANGMNIAIGGTTVTSNGGWVEVENAAGTISATRALTITPTTTANAALSAVRINGTQILVDGVNNSYGANGFRLQFEDPNDLGHDSSGNGNDFTATGFNTDPAGIWSDQVFTTGWATQDFTSTRQNFSQPPSSSFDGNPATAGQSNGGDSDSTYFVRFTTPIEAVTSIEMKPTNGSGFQYHYINGNQGTFSSGQVRQTIYSGPEITLETVGVNWIASSAGNGFFQLWINGIEYIDNTGADYDLMQDSPTQNYATLNPLPSTASTNNISNANLTWSTSSTNQASQTIALPTSGKYYFEYQLTSSNAAVGAVTSPEAPRLTVDNSGALFLQNYNVGSAASATIAPNADINGSATIIPSSEIQSWAYDADAGTIEVRSKNVLQYTIENFGINGPFYVQVDRASTTANEVSFNYGQQPFLYTPPAGFEALQTQNLPKDPIANGRDHFQAITGDGILSITAPASIAGGVINYDNPGLSGYPVTNGFDGNSSTAVYCQTNGDITFTFEPPIAGTTFILVGSFSAPSNMPTYVNGVEINQGTSTENKNISAEAAGSLRTIKITGNSGSAGGFNGVEVDGQLIVAGNGEILSIAQSTFPNGLWWIKDRVNSNQHQLVDSVRGADANIKVCPGLTNTNPYAPPAGDSVAWCWNAPDEMDQATRESGTIDVTAGRVNQAAGFSILEYEGNAANGATVAHGLTEAPEFLITIAQDNTNSIIVWSEAVGSTGLLNNANAFGGSQIVGTNNQFVTLSANTSVNSNTCSMYAWHSVENYSSFGSYEGGDQSFVHLDFKPAWVMIKRVSGGDGPWVIYDSTRDPSNPCTSYLLANAANPENPTVKDIDILSNGFKIKTVDSDISEVNDTYVYACFAENPFQSPVTAR